MSASEPANPIEVRSPYDGTKVGEVPGGRPTDVDDAVERARRGFFEVARAMTPHDRAALLAEVAERVRAVREDLASLITGETGKTIRDSRTEVERSVTTLRFSAEEAKRLHGRVLPCDVTPTRTGKTAYVHRVPLGVVAAITPFNFPLNAAAHKVAPAIAAGNTVVLTPSPRAPLAAATLARLFDEAGCPPGLLTVVHGGDAIGQRLVEHPVPRAVTLTGSVATGELVCRAAGLKKLLLELGGNDPLVVFPDADLPAASQAAVDHGLGTAGQRCTGVKRVFVHEEVFAAFRDALLERVRALRVGDPRDPETDLGPLIDEDAAIEVERRVEDAVEGGARVLHRGARRGALLPPIVLEDVPEDRRLVTEETFGPVLPLLVFRDLGDAVRRINATRYGLQAGVFTNRLDFVRRLRTELEVGALIVNDGPGFRVDSLPFGGVKSSGLGREGVLAAIEELTEDRMLVW